MALRVERVPTLQDNYSYVLVCDQTGEAAIVDAPEIEPLVKRVDALGCKVTRILSTHHHPDHSAANPALAKKYGAPVYGHVSDGNRIPGFTDGLTESDTLSVGRERARILFIPAHTRAHIAYVFDDAQALFCGDTLFAAGCGRLFEGTPEQMWKSLSRLRALPESTNVYCGHEYTQSNARFALTVDPANGDLKARAAEIDKLRAAGKATVPGTMGEERKTNPFLRADTPGVAGAVGLAGADPVKVFAEVRRRKDVFR